MQQQAAEERGLILHLQVFTKNLRLQGGIH